MFCARCWSAVGPHDRACQGCQLDLTRPGSVRLTDPRRIPRDVDGNPLAGPDATPAPTPPAPAYDAPAAHPAPPPAPLPAAAPNKVPAVKGPGWWSGMKAQVLALGAKAAEANRARAKAAEAAAAASAGTSTPVGPPGASPQRSTQPPVPPAGDIDEEQLRTVLRHPDADPDRTIIREPADDVDRTVIRESAADADKTIIREPSADADRTVIREPAADADRTVIREPGTQDADRTVMRRRREPGELSLWDDYGMTDSPDGLQIDRDASLREKIGHILGASALPTAKTVTFLAVVAASVLVLALLVGRLLTLDSLVIVNPGHTPSFATPEQTAAPATTEAPPPAEPSETPTPSKSPSRPATPQTPSMAAGAKQCDPGVWAGAQTSCALANAVADQVRLDMTGTVIVEAFSTSSNQTYRLECTANRGITCNGLDGVQGVHVWLVTNG